MWLLFVVEKFFKQPRERLLAGTDFVQVSRTLDEAVGSDATSSLTVAAIRIMMLTDFHKNGLPPLRCFEVAP